MNAFAALDGTLVDIATVVVGSALGLAVRGRLPERVTAVLLQTLGPTLYIGFTNAGDLTFWGGACGAASPRGCPTRPSTHGCCS